MNINKLIHQIEQKQSYLCVGLDTDINKLPLHIKGRTNAVIEFNHAIIDATKDFCVSYKINTAFYESQGMKGWQAMEETLHYIPDTHFTIADAKRGDIGNTSAHYAKTFFEVLPFDAVTVNPYMGEDSVRPFLEYEDKITILLGLTSNKGAEDFELQPVAASSKRKNVSQPETNDETILPDEPVHYLYETVLEKAASWGTAENIMFVAGATQTRQLAAIRRIVPDHFLLVPGIGAQGGSLADVSTNAMNKNYGLLVNVSRAVIYAGLNKDFGEKAGEAAQEFQLQMKTLLKTK